MTPYRAWLTGFRRPPTAEEYLAMPRATTTRIKRFGVLCQCHRAGRNLVCVLRQLRFCRGRRFQNMGRLHYRYQTRLPRRCANARIRPNSHVIVLLQLTATIHYRLQMSFDPTKFPPTMAVFAGAALMDFDRTINSRANDQRIGFMSQAMLNAHKDSYRIRRAEPELKGLNRVSPYRQSP